MTCLAKNIYKNVYYEIKKKFNKCYHSASSILNASKGSVRIREIIFAPIQTEKDKKHKKISIIGAAGKVGQITAYELFLKRISDELVLSELPEKREKLCGIALDLLDGSSFRNYPKIKICIDYEHTANSDLIVICAGLGVKKGQSRLDVLKDNADNFKTLVPILAKLSPESIMLVVSNPVDIMTYAAWKFSGFPMNRVLGTGTCLDTSRFKILLSKKLGISPKSINGFILGEHGQSCVASWSTINIAGTRLRDCKKCFGLKDDPECWFELEKQVKEQANVIKKFKGFTSYAISMVAAELSAAILMDQRTVHPVSTYCNGICGLKMEGFFSLPCVIGTKGVHQIIEQKLDKIEQEKLVKSAETLDKAMKNYNCSNSSNLIGKILFAPVQKEKDKKPKKVSIIGATGNVGQIMGFNLILKRLCDEVVLCDIPEQEGKLSGIGLDILDGTSFVNHPKIKLCANMENTKDSDLLIICAGIGPKVGESRLDTMKQNAEYFRVMIPTVVTLSPDCVILVITNPVDIMAYAAWKFSGFPRNRVLGTGTSLDSSRLRYCLSKKLGISPKSINAFMIGEHGESCVTCWSTINVAGTRLRDCVGCFGLKKDPECWFELEKQTIHQPFTILSLRGFTNFAISIAASEISEAILMDKRTVHPVSTYCNGVHGLQIQSFLSLPAVIGNRGVHQIIKQKLDSNELKQLKKSASILDKISSSYNWDVDQKKEKKTACN